MLSMLGGRGADHRQVSRAALGFDDDLPSDPSVFAHDSTVRPFSPTPGNVMNIMQK